MESKDLELFKLNYLKAWNICPLRQTHHRVAHADSQFLILHLLRDTWTSEEQGPSHIKILPFFSKRLLFCFCLKKTIWIPTFQNELLSESSHVNLFLLSFSNLIFYWKIIIWFGLMSEFVFGVSGRLLCRLSLRAGNAKKQGLTRLLFPWYPLFSRCDLFSHRHFDWSLISADCVSLLQGSINGTALHLRRRLIVKVQW